jgi:hypothetical protein
MRIRRTGFSKLALVLVIGVGVTAASHMYASQDTERVAPALTALDYIEIQHLVNRYAFAIDTCSNNGYDYADLYTADGIFYYGINARTAVGREQLAEAAGGGRLGCKKLQTATREKPLQTHVTVNLVIEPSPEGATGKSYLVYPGVRGIGADPDHSGHVGGYQDVYVRTLQGWRIKKRIHIFPPEVPGSFVFP